MAKNCTVGCKVESWQKTAFDAFVTERGRDGVTLPSMRLRGNTISDIIRPVVDYITEWYAKEKGIIDMNEAKVIAQFPYDNPLTQELTQEVIAASQRHNKTLADLESMKQERNHYQAEYLKKDAVITSLEEEIKVLRTRLEL